MKTAANAAAFQARRAFGPCAGSSGWRVSTISPVKIHQFSVSFEAAHDRLLLRIISQGGEEVSVWLTRRLLRRVLPGLNEMAGIAETAQQPQLHAPDTAARQWVGELARSKHIEKSDFSTPYAAGRVADRPLGAAPLLITDVNLKPLTDGPRPVLRIELVERLPGQPERSLQAEVTPKVLHGLIHVIEQGVAQTDWNRSGPAIVAVSAQAVAPYAPTPGAITPARPAPSASEAPVATEKIASSAQKQGAAAEKDAEVSSAPTPKPAAPEVVKHLRVSVPTAPAELVDLVRPKYLN